MSTSSEKYCGDAGWLGLVLTCDEKVIWTIRTDATATGDGRAEPVPVYVAG